VAKKARPKKPAAPARSKPAPAAARAKAPPAAAPAPTSTSIVTLDELAKFLNVSERRVQQLAKDGMPRAASGQRGQYNLLVCASWYIRFLQRAVERRRNPDGPPGIDAERARLAGVNADIRELELAQLRGELVEVEAIGKLWDKAIERLRARMLASVGDLAVQCVGLETKAEAHSILLGIVRDALTGAAATAADVNEGDAGVEDDPQAGEASGVAEA